MAKRIVVLFFFILALALWLDAGSWMSALAQRVRSSGPPRQTKYSNFKHSSHAGRVKSLTQAKASYDLDCAYCHGTAVKDRLGKDLHGIEATGFPNQKNAVSTDKTHSACVECHAFTGAKIERDMCTICHDKMDTNPRKMATNIRAFPDQDLSPVSEFFDNYSHGNHVGYFESFATQTPLKDRVKFYDAKGEQKANAKLDKNKFECSACHTNNSAPQIVGKITFAPGVKEKAPGHPECFVCHFDPKIIDPPKPDKPNAKNTFATNCSGCHQEIAKPYKDNRPVLGSEPAVLWFARQIINTEYNPKKEGVKAPLPYSHKTHDDAVGKTVKDCLSCHVTGKTASTRSDFYLEDKKTKEKQPQITTCVDCHDKEMKTKIEGAVTLETAKCNYCHSLQTIRTYSIMGVQLPPPNHFGGKPPKPQPVLAANTPKDPKPTPAPTPAPQTTGQDVAKVNPPASPTVKPEEPKPTPAPTPATPTVKPEEPKPTPAPTPAPAEDKVAVNTPPKENPAPATAPATTAAAKPPAGGPEPLPGKILLGDPKQMPKEWGEFGRGPTEFDHNSHLKPPYSKNCEECHHTNKDTRNEAVQKCWECHFQEGFEAKGQSKVNLKDAYHGVEEPANKAINAGCIECHKRYYEANPDKEKTGPTTKCAGCHLEKTSNLQIRQRNEWLIEQWTALFRYYWVETQPRIALATRRP
jgi:hypothetical protein